MDDNISRLSADDFEFVIPNECKNSLSKTGKGHLSYKGAMMNTYCWCKFGKILKGNDNVTAHFEMGNIGVANNYGFGFISPKCKRMECYHSFNEKI